MEQCVNGNARPRAPHSPWRDEQTQRAATNESQWQLNFSPFYSNNNKAENATLLYTSIVFSVQMQAF